MATLADQLAQRTRVGELYERLDDGRIVCVACGHRCPLPDGSIGVCKVRFNRGGRLYVPWGYVAGVQCDPIEKKPFFHAYPGAIAYSFGMLGFHSSEFGLDTLLCFRGEPTAAGFPHRERGRSDSASSCNLAVGWLHAPPFHLLSSALIQLIAAG